MQSSVGFLEGTKLNNIFLSFSVLSEDICIKKDKKKFMFVKRLCLTLLNKKKQKKSC